MAYTNLQDYTGVDGTQLTTLSGWSYVIKTAGTLDTSAAIFTNQLRLVGLGKTGAGIYITDCASNDNYIKATFQVFTNGFTNLGVRVTDADNGIFLDVRATNAFVSKKVAGSTTSLGSVTNSNVAGDVYELRVIGNNVTLLKNGSKCLVSTNVADVPAANNAGICTTVNANWTIDNTEAGNFGAGNGLEITQVSKVYQRVGTTKAVPFSGTYGGSVSGIQYRIEDTGGSALSGFDWQTPATSYVFGSGAWSFITDHTLAQGGPYKLRVRAVSVTLEATAQYFSVGIMIAIYGQSNATGFEYGGTSLSTPVTPTSTNWIYTLQALNGGWIQGGSAGSQRMIEDLKVILGGIPVGTVEHSKGGTPSNLLKPGNTVWTEFTTAITATGGDIEALVYNQGESGSSVVATYKSDLQSMHSALATLTGRPTSGIIFCVSGLGHYTLTPDATVNSTYNNVRQAQREFASENAGAVLGETQFDISQLTAPPDSGYHFDGTDNGHYKLAKRYALTLGYLIGATGTPGYGPRIRRATRSGAVVTLYINMNGATSLTKGDVAAATGWTASNDNWATTLTVSDVQVSGSTVVLTLSAPPSGTVKVRHMWDASPDITNQIKGTGYTVADIGMQGDEVTESAVTYAASGPSSGTVNTPSTNFTVTFTGSTVIGDVVVLTANNGNITVTAVGATITNNGTSTVTVTMPASLASFTYTYTPLTTGAKTITYTNNNGWANPSVQSYTSNAAVTSSSSARDWGAGCDGGDD